MRTWDIMVPTFYGRTPIFLELLDQLEAQMRPGVRVVCERGERDPAGIAAKQQRLLEATSADYVSICADDALLHPRYVELIHDAMQCDPDVIGFSFQLVGGNGRAVRREQVHSIAFARCESLHAPGRPDLGWGLEFCDLGTWMPVRRSIAIRCSFTDGLDEEDHDAFWTRRVLATGLLKREVYLNDVLVMPQVRDAGFHGSWYDVPASPNPEREFVTYT
jgi:hypothetical protein